MKGNPARTFAILAIAGGICTAGPGTAGAAELLSATRPVIAIMDGELYLGRATGHLDGAGTVAIHAQKNPALTCLGDFTSSAVLGGKGTLRCSDGTNVPFRFQRQGPFRGYGAGTTPRGEMTFAYGHTAESSLPYLNLPGGKRLRGSGTELTLVDP